MDIPYNKEELKQFLVSVIEKYRMRYKKEGIKQISKLVDLRSPVQFHVIWLYPFDQQYIFFTHLPTLPDKEIIIVHCDYENILDELSIWSNSDFFDVPLPSVYSKHFKFKVKTHRDIAQLRAKQIYDEQPKRIFRSIEKSSPNEEEFDFGIMIWGNGGEWYFDDTISLDVEFIINKLFNTEKAKYLGEEIFQPIEERVVSANNKLKSYGCFIYPNLWIGRDPFTDLKSKVRGIQVGKILRMNTHIIFHLWNIHFSITQAGYIEVICEKRAEALESLNSLMGILSFFGRITHSIKPQDLGISIFDLSNSKISERKSIKDSRMDWIMNKRFIDYEVFSQEFIIVSEEDLLSVLDKTSKIPEKIKVLFNLYIEMKTLFIKEAYEAGFLIGWSLIEGLINFVWKEYLEEKKGRILPKKKIKKMIENPNWSITIKTDVLLMLEILPNDLIQKINKCRMIRNDLSHRFFDKEVNFSSDVTNEMTLICDKLLSKTINM